MKLGLISYGTYVIIAGILRVTFYIFTWQTKCEEVISEHDWEAVSDKPCTICYKHVHKVCILADDMTTNFLLLNRYQGMNAIWQNTI